MTHRLAKSLAGAAALAALAWAATAADHAEAPAATADPAADIADIFLFREEGRLVVAMTFSGIAAPNPRVDGPAGNYDPDVLYRFHFDTDQRVRDGTLANYVVDARFGQDSQGQWGVELENVPGAGARHVFGPVEFINSTPTGLRFYAGLRDDPFFFDNIGFGMTLSTFSGSTFESDDCANPTGENLFDNTRDGFAFRNLTVIVFEMDIDEASQGSDIVHFWGTTHRIAGDGT